MCELSVTLGVGQMFELLVKRLSRKNFRKNQNRKFPGFCFTFIYLFIYLFYFLPTGIFH